MVVIQNNLFICNRSTQLFESLELSTFVFMKRKHNTIPILNTTITKLVGRVWHRRQATIKITQQLIFPIDIRLIFHWGKKSYVKIASRPKFDNSHALFVISIATPKSCRLIGSLHPTLASYKSSQIIYDPINIFLRTVPISPYAIK